MSKQRQPVPKQKQQKFFPEDINDRERDNWERGVIVGLTNAESFLQDIAANAFVAHKDEKAKDLRMAAYDLKTKREEREKIFNHSRHERDMKRLERQTGLKVRR